jgi:hypothetical protein
MPNIEELKKRLRSPVRFGAETQEQAKRRHFMERKEAATALESQSAEIARLKAELEEALDEAKLFKHGHRIASDNCVRLEGLLEEARKDAHFDIRLARYEDGLHALFVSSKSNTWIRVAHELTECVDTIITAQAIAAARKQQG